MVPKPEFTAIVLLVDHEIRGVRGILQSCLQLIGVIGQLGIFLFESVDSTTGLFTDFRHPRLQDEEDDGDHEERGDQTTDHIASGGAGLGLEFRLPDRPRFTSHDLLGIDLLGRRGFQSGILLPGVGQFGPTGSQLQFTGHGKSCSLLDQLPLSRTARSGPISRKYRPLPRVMVQCSRPTMVWSGGRTTWHCWGSRPSLICSMSSPKSST